MNIKEMIEKLPEPSIFREVKVEEVIAQNVQLMKSLNPDWIPIESDSNMMQIEAFSYKETMLRNMFNNAIKAMLPHYSKGNDLDNFAFGFYAGETRLEGKGPIALYEFSIEEVLTQDLIIPQGLELSDGDTTTSFLTEDIKIVAGTLKAFGTMQLNQKVKSSNVKTEVNITPYPYVLNPVAITDFTDGREIESDEDFFKRAILSLYKYSTAGGEGAYKYFTYSADERVFDVKILSPNPMLIDVVVLALEGVEDTVNNVNIALTGDEKTQAFCDVVSVRAANKKNVVLDLTVHIFDLLKQLEISQAIKSALSNQFKIGESLPYSSLVSKIHISGVYKVELATTEDITTQEDEYISIEDINITFKEAVL